MDDVRKCDGGSAWAPEIGPRMYVPSPCHNGLDLKWGLPKTGQFGAHGPD